MIKVKGYHHVNLHVDDIGKADRFYGGLLGCERLSGPLSSQGSWFKLGSSELHIGVTSGGPPEGWGHIVSTSRTTKKSCARSGKREWTSKILRSREAKTAGSVSIQQGTRLKSLMGQLPHDALFGAASASF